MYVCARAIVCVRVVVYVSARAIESANGPMIYTCSCGYL